MPPRWVTVVGNLSHLWVHSYIRNDYPKRRSIVSHGKILALTVLGVLSSAICPDAALPADDPWNAFPTADMSADERVKGLTAAQLQAIRIPENGADLVLSFSTIRPTDGQQKSAPEDGLWLRVFANGQIDCRSLISLPTDRRSDTLTKPELAWLLHLAVNECQITKRSTKEIEDDFQRTVTKLPVTGEPPSHFRYYVKLPSGTDDLSIPEKALVVRPVRASMQLGAFASLNKYATWLVSRAYLGNPKERQSMLEQLNARLKKEHPAVPPFRIEHLVRGRQYERCRSSARPSSRKSTRAKARSIASWGRSHAKRKVPTRSITSASGSTRKSRRQISFLESAAGSQARCDHGDRVLVEKIRRPPLILNRPARSVLVPIVAARRSSRASERLTAGSTWPAKSGVCRIARCRCRTPRTWRQ